MSIKDFNIISKIGQGSFATVFKAQRILDNKTYALKQIRINQLDAKSKQNALNQVRLLASFDCRNIIKYYQAFFEESENLLCIVMEYAEGGDLGQLIKAKKMKKEKFYQIQIWKVLISLVHGLDYLHERSILHRDIKPQNIFLCNQTHKIGDLNVSRIIQQNYQQKLTQIGTPFYASPEIWQNSPYDNKCDIWSLGCLIYEMATLNPPFHSKSMDKLYEEITKQKIKPIPQHYSNELAQIIARCLEKKAENRPSVRELLDNFTVKMYENLYYSTEELQIQKSKYQPLLKTITFPKNKNIKSVELPNANYDKQQNNMRNSSNINIQIDNNQNSCNKEIIERSNKIDQNVQFEESCQLQQSEQPSARSIKRQIDLSPSLQNVNNQKDKPIVVVADVMNQIKQQIKQAKEQFKKQPSIKKLMLEQPIFNKNDNKIKNSLSKYRHYSEMGLTGQQSSNSKKIIDEFKGVDKSKKNCIGNRMKEDVLKNIQNMNPEHKTRGDSGNKNRRSLPRTELSAKKIQVCTQMANNHKITSAQKSNLMQQNNNCIDDYKKALLSKLPQNLITSISAHKHKKSIIQELVSHQKSRDKKLCHQIQGKISNNNKQLSNEMVRKRSKIFISNQLQNIFDQNDHNKNNNNKQRCHQKGRIASVPSVGKIY